MDDLLKRARVVNLFSMCLLRIQQFATITVLVGGGCDDRKEYVELLADGVGVAKATGTCSEAMFAVR